MFLPQTRHKLALDFGCFQSIANALDKINFAAHQARNSHLSGVDSPIKLGVESSIKLNQDMHPLRVTPWLLQMLWIRPDTLYLNETISSSLMITNLF